MPRFKEVAQRYMKIGNRTFMEGDTVRTVSISERDATILNDGTGTDYTNGHGMKYILEEEAAKEPTKKEVRDALLLKAEELGLEFKKNISNTDLQKLIEENTPAS